MGRMLYYDIDSGQFFPCPDDPNEPAPVTNADRIREMSHEELAEFLFPLGSCPIVADGLPFNDNADCAGDCDKCWFDWLRQEVQDG